jgi:hypothetical protein
MIAKRKFSGAVASLVGFSLVANPASALVNLNEGHDHVYVTGTMTMGWDSNVFANADAKSDFTVATSFLAEYQRRAGWIGVNASVGIDSTRYNVFSSENFNNPRFYAELTKQTGRTTGSLTLNAARQSRADAAINARTVSWNLGAGLNFRYPIITTYTLSGQLGYTQVRYENGVFPTLSTYSASTDLIRLLTSERDLSLGYRYRHSQSSIDTTYDDHAFTVGLNGKLIRGINGNLKGGYQVRIPHGPIPVGGTALPKFSSWTASGSATYAINKRSNLTGTISKDFSVTANEQSVDTTTAAIDYQFAYNSHWSFNASVSGGDSRFLGDSGRVVVSLGPPPVLGPARHDDFLTASASINYSLNEHLKVAASYVWFKNWSNSSFAEFVRTGYNLNLSSRW